MSEERDRRGPPDEEAAAAAPAVDEPPSGEPRVIGETTILGDGQLGGENLERGPERINPEGTVDIANPPRDER